jgi:hypothetical protein
MQVMLMINGQRPWVMRVRQVNALARGEAGAR